MSSSSSAWTASPARSATCSKSSSGWRMAAPTFARCVSPSTLQRPRACFPSRSSARSRSSNARRSPSARRPASRRRRDLQGGAGARPRLHRRCHCVDGPMASDGPPHAAPIPVGGRGPGPEPSRRGSMDHRALAASRSESRARAARRRQPAGKDPAQTAGGSPDDDGRGHRHGKS